MNMLYCTRIIIEHDSVFMYVLTSFPLTIASRPAPAKPLMRP